MEHKLGSDDAALKTLGERLARHRLNRNQTQAAVAREAGVSRRTVSKVENGHVIDTRGLVRILRALGLLGSLDELLPSPGPSPVALSERQGRIRERARGRRSPDEPDSAEWTWPDQEQ